MLLPVGNDSFCCHRPDSGKLAQFGRCCPVQIHGRAGGRGVPRRRRAGGRQWTNATTPTSRYPEEGPEPLNRS